MKFQKGDIVVCINKSKDSVLILNKKYVVEHVMTTEHNVVYVVIEGMKYIAFHYSYFIKLEEYRTNKINKIKYNINGNKKYNKNIINIDFASLYPTAMGYYLSKSKREIEISKRNDKIKKIINRIGQ